MNSLYMQLSYEALFLVSLAITLACEVTVVVLLVRFWLDKTRSLFEVALLASVASMATLPYLWFIAPWLIKDYYWRIISGEIILTLFEALVYAVFLKCHFTKALIISIFANASSIIVGLIVY